MANDDREAFFGRASNWHGGEPESWEKTHDEFGNYIGSGAAYNNAPFNNNGMPPINPQAQQQQNQFTAPMSDAMARTEREINKKVHFGGYTAPPRAENPQRTGDGSVDLSDLSKYIPPDVYDNFLIYCPQNSADVEKLIDYLRSRKPAIVDLDPICDSPDAQRVLDFTSGAVYALGGKIAPIKPNLFLIVSDKGKISQSD